MLTSDISHHRILRGGAESGFKKVEPTKYEPRLLHFHGNRKHIEVTEVGNMFSHQVVNKS